MIMQMDSGGNHDITITNFNIDGSAPKDAQKGARGMGNGTLIHLYNCKNVTVSYMYLHDALGDGFRSDTEPSKYDRNGLTNISFHHNRADNLGHDGCFVVRASGIEAYENNIETRSDGGIRLFRSKIASIHNNTIYAPLNGTGGPGVLIESDGTEVVENIQIFQNVFEHTYGPGIWVIGHDVDNKAITTGVHIFNNQFTNCGLNNGIDWVGGVVVNGFDKTLIENNIFDGCYGSAVSHNNPTMGNSKGSSVAIKVLGTGYQTYLNQNKIMNSQPQRVSSDAKGYGVWNKRAGNIFHLTGNTIQNNAGGDTVGSNIIFEAKFDSSIFTDYTIYNYSEGSSSWGSSLGSTLHSIYDEVTSFIDLDSITWAMVILDFFMGDSDEKTEDTEPPTTPQNLKETEILRTQNSVTLYWNTSRDNEILSGYQIHQGDGSLIGQSLQSCYEIEGLSPDTTYTFYVTAIDGSNNVSEKSNSVTVRTRSANFNGSTGKFKFEFPFKAILKDDPFKQLKPTKDIDMNNSPFQHYVNDISIFDQHDDVSVYSNKGNGGNTDNSTNNSNNNGGNTGNSGNDIIIDVNN
jgi:hypothetical protein